MYNSIKKDNILKEKFNQVGPRLVHWKLQNTVEIYERRPRPK